MPRFFETFFTAARCTAALLAALLVGGGPAFAQGRDLRPLPPPILVSAGAERPIAVRGVTIDARLTAELAETTIELRFHNPNGRILEGELQFPLAPGQSVAGFALDIDGTMRDAVPVEKPRAQAVFEDITRQRVDPALLQTTAGENFKLRVYPIPAGGERIVRIRLLQPLEHDGTAARAYRLALPYAPSAEHFALRIVTTAKSRPRVRGFAPRIEQAGGETILAADRLAPGARGAVEVALAAEPTPAVTFGRWGEHTYFYAEVPFEAARRQAPAPKSLGIVWDASGSGADRDHVRELAFLDAYFSRVREVTVKLVRVRDRAEAAETYTVAKGDWRALRAALAATPYDGATDLAAFTPDPALDAVLLFSDGLANYGEQAFPTMRAPVHAVVAAPRTDTARLRAVAEASGGRFVDLARMAPATAAGLVASSEAHVETLASDGATDLVIASRHAEQGRLAIAGRMTESRATLSLALTDGRTLAVPLAPAAEVAAQALAPTMWARLRLASLEGEPQIHRAEIRRIGMAFRLPTRETSLLVLDRVEDYARFAIDPPEPLRVAYDRLRAVTRSNEDALRRTQLDRVVKLLAAKMAWWQRDFPKEGRPVAISKDAQRPAGASGRVQERAEREQAAGSAVRDRMMAPSAPQAAPAPAPAANEQRLAQRADAPALKNGVRASSEPAMTIALKPWSADAAYARRLREASAADAYRVYLDERPGFVASTAFFLDAADVLFEKGLKDLGLRVLSNLAEMELENRAILRILGHRLMQAEAPATAVAIFRRVRELAPNEPQSHRDLGLALAASGRPQEAIESLYEVVIRPWHGRFPEIELTALAELNAIRIRAKQPLDVSRIDPRLVVDMPLDLRVVLTWDADNTDIDLWVTDPNGERSFYGNRMSYQGARMSPDFTGGYGPEEFALKKAKPGKYKIEANFYGHNQQIVAGATTLQVWLATRFGTPDESDKAITLRLAGKSEVVYVGEFEVK